MGSHWSQLEARVLGVEGFDGAIAWEITNTKPEAARREGAFSWQGETKAGRVGCGGEVEIRMGCSFEWWWCDVDDGGGKEEANWDPISSCIGADVVSESQVLGLSFPLSPFLPSSCFSSLRDANWNSPECRRDLSRAHHRLPRGRCLSAWLPTLPHALCFGMGARRLRDIWDYYVVLAAGCAQRRSASSARRESIACQADAPTPERCQLRQRPLSARTLATWALGCALLK